MTYFIDNKYRVYEIGETVGSGGGGIVYALHPVINSEGKFYFAPKESETGLTYSPGKTGSIEIPGGYSASKVDQHKFALKELKESITQKANILEKERIGISKLYSKVKPEIVAEKFVISELLQGKSYSEDFKGEIFSDWSFDARIDFAFQWALQLNQLHNDTTNGPALMHLDIKPANMILNFNASDKQKPFGLNVQPLDFDISESITVKEDSIDIKGRLITSQDQLRKVELRGTPGYIPPELQNDYGWGGQSAGARSDIYSLSSLVWAVFGANNPIDESEKNNDNDFKIYVNYNPNGILNKNVIPHWLKCDGELLKSIKKFILRLGAFYYYTRPTTDEFLTFFTKFRTLHLINLNEKSQDYGHEKEKLAFEMKNLADQTDPTFKIFLQPDEINNWIQELNKNINLIDTSSTHVVIFKDNNQWKSLELTFQKQEQEENKFCYQIIPSNSTEILSKAIISELENIENGSDNYSKIEIEHETKRMFYDNKRMSAKQLSEWVLLDDDPEPEDEWVIISEEDTKKNKP